MKDKKKLIVLIVMLLMPVAGIWYFIKMSLKYMKGAEIEIFFSRITFFKQFGGMEHYLDYFMDCNNVYRKKI